METSHQTNFPPSYEEVLIDLDNPRPQWYLDINPRGLVPTIKYSVPGLFEEEIITESDIVSRFLADAFPSEFLPASKESPSSALERARINFFVDTWNTKVGNLLFPILMAKGDAKGEKVDAFAAAVEKEIEPLLKNARPFFNGSETLTLAEAILAPFVVRTYDYAADEELMPHALIEKLDALPNFSKWAKAVQERESVRKNYDGEGIAVKTKAKLGKMAEKMAAEKK
jgi:glutathione S-transferase